MHLIELLLLNPQDLLISYKLSQPTKVQIIMLLNLLQQALILDSDPRTMKNFNKKLQQIEPVEILPLSEDLFVSTRLTPQQIQEFDQYMQVKHVKTCVPEELIVTSLITAYLGLIYLGQSFDIAVQEIHLTKVGFQECISLLRRVFDLEYASSNNISKASIKIQIKETKKDIKIAQKKEAHNLFDINALDIWRKGHWVFLVFTQALILVLRRFIEAVNLSNLKSAKIELQTATNLLWASGAAMKIAGNFNREQYENEVRFTMTPGHPQSLVQSEALSGLMMWEHDYLVNVIWKNELLPLFKNFPSSLQSEHENFVRAYQEGLSLGHKNVCAKFGGGEMESLIASHGNTALKNLERFEVNRLKMLAPHNLVNSNKNKCPFHKIDPL